MAFEKGNDIRLSIGDILIGGQQNCSINRETETAETTTKDSGVWAESEKYKTGKAIITSLSSNSPSKEKTTYSVSLQGVGALAKN